ncbi:unnamed protein product [Closterium sp. NIES-53]
MEVARTSMIHAAAPHFLWLFAVWYDVHQLNIWPRVSLPETLPTLRWTGEVGDASVFRVWGSFAYFYHPTSCRVFPSQDVTFDESVPFYHLFPYRSAPPPPPPLFLAPDPLFGPAPVQVAASRGAASGGAEPGSAESKGAETGGAEPGGVATGGGEPGGAEPEGVEPGGAASEGAESGASGVGGAGAAGAGGTGVAAGAGVTGGTTTTGPGGARTRGTGAAGTGGVEGAGAGDLTEAGATGAVAAGAGGAGVGGHGAGGTGVRGPGVGGARAGGAGAVDPGDASQPPLQPASPLPAPSPYAEQSGGLTERREPASRPVSPVRNARRVPRSRPLLVPVTHAMTLHVPLPAPPELSFSEVLDPESDCAHAASRLLATADTDPSLESAAASALVAEMLDIAAACRIDYTTALVAASASASSPSIGGECALGTDVLEDRQEDFECLAATVPRFASMLLAPEGDLDTPDIPTPHSYAEAITAYMFDTSQWHVAKDAEMAFCKSTGTYVDEVPSPGANIVDGMWIFRGVDYFQTFSPTPKMTTLWVLLHVAAQRDYELHSQDFSTAFLQGSLHEEICLRRPPGFNETTLEALGFAPATHDPSLFLRSNTSLPPFYVLVYVNDLVFATADTEALTLVKSELHKRHTCTDLGPSALRLPVLLATARSSVYKPLTLRSTFGQVRRAEWSVPRACGTSGMGLVLGGWGQVVLTCHADASYVDDSATQRSSEGYTFSLGSGSVSWRSTHSSSVLSSSCEAEIYAVAMAA